MWRPWLRLRLIFFKKVVLRDSISWINSETLNYLLILWKIRGKFLETSKWYLYTLYLWPLNIVHVILNFVFHMMQLNICLGLLIYFFLRKIEMHFLFQNCLLYSTSNKFSEILFQERHFDLLVPAAAIFWVFFCVRHF